eukprot:2714861-Rhodomonas_salina.1
MNVCVTASDAGCAQIAKHSVRTCNTARMSGLNDALPGESIHRHTPPRQCVVYTDRQDAVSGHEYLAVLVQILRRDGQA